MKFNIYFLIIFLIISFIVGIIVGILIAMNLSKDSYNFDFSGNIKLCPEKWVRDESPCVYNISPSECNKEPKDYFIYEGQRRELYEFDLPWIVKSCNLIPEIIA